MALLELNHISKFYSDGVTSSKGLDDVSLKFDAGEFVAITGESGSGKTTLLNVMTLMDDYDSGTMLFEGKDSSEMNQKEILELRKNYISFVFQDYNLIQSLTAYQNILIALRNKGYEEAECKRRATKALDDCKLSHRKNNKVVSLSGGERQRVVIARALALDSPIIAFDEPTGNLDSQTSSEIIHLVNSLKKNHLILYVTHDYQSVEPFCTRHVILKDGKVIEDINLRAKDNSVLTKQEDLKPRGVKKASLRLLSSSPKKLILMCLSLIFFSIGCSLMGMAVANSIVDAQVERLNVEKNVNSSLFSQKDPNAVLYTNLGEGLPEAVQNADYYDKKGDFSMLICTLKDTYFPSVENTLPIRLTKMDKAEYLAGEESEEAGFYLCYNSKWMTKAMVEDEVRRYGFKQKVGNTDELYFLIPDDFYEFSPDVYQNCLNQELNKLTFKGIIFGSSTSFSDRWIYLNEKARDMIAPKVDQFYQETLQDEKKQGLLSEYEYSLHNRSFRKSSISKMVELSFDEKTGTPSKQLPFLEGYERYNQAIPFYLSSYYRTKKDQISLTAYGVTYTLSEFLTKLGVVNVDSVFVDFNTAGLGNCYLNTTYENLFSTLFDRQFQSFSVAYFSSEDKAKTAASKDVEKYHPILLSASVINAATANYVRMLYIMAMIFPIAMIILSVLVIILLALFTTPVLSIMFDKYNPDFAVLMTLGFSKKSLNQMKRIIIIVPVLMTFTLSAIICLSVVASKFSSLFPTALLVLLCMFALLFVSGYLFVAFIDRRNKKKTMSQMLKDAGGK